jgi:hypothetical protein
MSMLIKKIISLKVQANYNNYLEVLIQDCLLIYEKTDLKQSKDSKPVLITLSNPLCLLNLPDVMRICGSVKNIWEGEIYGEAYLKIVQYQLKAEWVNDLQIWVITNLSKDNIFGSWKESKK